MLNAEQSGQTRLDFELPPGYDGYLEPSPPATVYTRDNIHYNFAHAWIENVLFANLYKTTVCIKISPNEY